MNESRLVLRDPELKKYLESTDANGRFQFPAGPHTGIVASHPNGFALLFPNAVEALDSQNLIHVTVQLREWTKLTLAMDPNSTYKNPGQLRVAVFLREIPVRLNLEIPSGNKGETTFSWIPPDHPMQFIWETPNSFFHFWPLDFRTRTIRPQNESSLPVEAFRLSQEIQLEPGKETRLNIVPHDAKIVGSILRPETTSPQNSLLEYPNNFLRVSLVGKPDRWLLPPTSTSTVGRAIFEAVKSLRENEKRFEFNEVPPGTYSLKISLPPERIERTKYMETLTQRFYDFQVHVPEPAANQSEHTIDLGEIDLKNLDLRERTIERNFGVQ